MHPPPKQNQIWAGGLRPALTRDSLYTAVCLLGANVMPHNFYLHSALVAGQATRKAAPSIARLSLYNLLDVAAALGVALLVNVAVLLVAAAQFHSHGLVVETLQARAGRRGGGRGGARGALLWGQSRPLRRRRRTGRAMLPQPPPAALLAAAHKLNHALPSLPPSAPLP